MTRGIDVAVASRAIRSWHFTFALFVATAAVPVGPTLVQTKLGALASVAGTLLALGAARLLRVGRFAP